HLTFARATAKKKIDLLRLGHRHCRLSAHIDSAFSISSTLSVFLKPLSADLGISRGTFSLIRSGEILIGAAAAPMVGTLMDRFGGRWLMAAGGLISGAGFICLGQARDYIQFMLVRWLLITPGDSLMGSMVINVSIARWFVRMRGRALAIAGMGHGLAKVCMPVAAATLMLYVGWRGSWVVFGVFALLLVVAPAVLFMRRSPEEMGLLPDGCPVKVKEAVAKPQKRRYAKRTGADNVEWSRREALRTPVFWLIASTFGVAQIGVTGLNLHVFSYVTDQGHSTLVAASVMSIIAVMQFSTPIVWGMLADRMDNGILNMAKCGLQGAGLLLALSLPGMTSLYAGFFVYGIGMGGTAVLAETIWADFFGRVSLGKIRGMGSLVTSLFSAGGPPFFGLLFDHTHSYHLSFNIFICMLFTSAVLSLCLRPPTKQPGLAA
ncbi:MAG TPA: MFS transporter, partial [Candidatus Binatia bacterium]|nr:MFS transporter [Candidatus Binatia bacterium]